MAYGKCFLSGHYGIVERHHIFGGALRKKSEKLGLVVELSPQMHREGPQAAHKCWETRSTLCRYGQKKAMIEQDWDVDTFVREFGRNWLYDEELDEVEALREENRKPGACAGWLNNLLDEMIECPEPEEETFEDAAGCEVQRSRKGITIRISFGDEELPF